MSLLKNIAISCGKQGKYRERRRKAAVLSYLNLLLCQVRLKAREDLSRLPDGLDRFVIKHSDTDNKDRVRQIKSISNLRLLDVFNL